MLEDAGFLEEGFELVGLSEIDQELLNYLILFVLYFHRQLQVLAIHEIMRDSDEPPLTWHLPPP